MTSCKEILSTSEAFQKLISLFLIIIIIIIIIIMNFQSAIREAT